MSTRIIGLFHLIVLCSGLIAKATTATPGHRKVSSFQEKQKSQDSVPISTRQMDITTPITTVPTVSTTPTSTNPILNPTTTNPDSPVITNPVNPVTTPLTVAGPSSSSGSWCVATQSVSQAALQTALDYACGHGGADCSSIQPSGNCFIPNTLHQHASFAFNSYYQKNPLPSSCNFGGTAVTTSTDPSYATCQYKSTSTTSSVLNITNSSGSRVFGAGRPITPATSVAAIPSSITNFEYFLVFIYMVLHIY